MRNGIGWGSVGTRWLGAGLVAILSVVSLGLAFTGRLGLYINPESAWFVVGMAVLALVGVALSFTLPLGAESDHGHDHGDGAAAEHAHDADAAHRPAPAHPVSLALTVAGGVMATGVAAATLVLPPASLSVELAMQRDTGTAALFAGADDVALAASADTSKFGVGEWATVFSTATDPDVFRGETVTLTGFVTPDADDADALQLSRLIITHCVIDAQPAAVPVASPGWEGDYEVGDWIEVDGTVTADASGALVIEPKSITAIGAPEDPYEY